MDLKQFINRPETLSQADPVARIRLAIAELEARGQSFELVSLRDHLNWLLMFRKDPKADSKRQTWEHLYAARGTNIECTGSISSELHYWDSERSAAARNFDRAFYLNVSDKQVGIYFAAWRLASGPSHAAMKLDAQASLSLRAALSQIP